MQMAARLAARKPSRLARWFWGLAAALVSFMASVAAWTFVTDLLAPPADPRPDRHASLVVAFVLGPAGDRAARDGRLCAAAPGRRAAVGLPRKPPRAMTCPAARAVVAKLKRLYRAAATRCAGGSTGSPSATPSSSTPTRCSASPRPSCILPLDAIARREIEAAARQVATVTAIVPLALADVATALTANMRMIRRIAEIYGGRAGALGSLRLTRAVMTHLVATGAVAVGDDLIGSVAGGHLLSKLSRRFGEGIVNGALTARVGVAAMEVCRPVPFTRGKRPSVTADRAARADRAVRPGRQARQAAVRPGAVTQPGGARILVLGAYGLIGAEVARALAARGHRVTGFGRDRRAASRVLPGLDWVFADMRALTTPEAWRPHLGGMDFVVNCAGALQAGGKDDLDAVHCTAIGALVRGCEAAGAGIVQISAVGAEAGSPLAFFRTKAGGDAFVRVAGVAWWIFRPGLVIAPSAYGGTALLRSLAAVPVIQPVALPATPVQTVSVHDVAEAVIRAVEGVTPPGLEADLVEPEARPLVEIVAATRRWLGVASARRTFTVPMPLLRVAGWIADGLGVLGWRSPLRSTAIAALSQGIGGRAEQTRAALGRPARSLDDTLRAMPASVEDRLFARAQLVTPLLILALALAWIGAGAAGLAGGNSAAAALEARGVPAPAGRLAVALLSALSIGLGLGVVVRRWAASVLGAMMLTALVAGAALALLVPQLWRDPFGPFPAIVLASVAALAARVMMDTR